MKTRVIVLIAIIGIMISSCELLFDEESNGLSTEEVVEGLKTALIVGTDTSSTLLSKANGYYGDELVKIPLPSEAESIREIITNNDIANLLNLDEEFENVVKSINRAAEDAAEEAKPIFKSAIDSLSLKDAWDILNGENPAGTLKSSSNFDSTAATNYFKSVTKQPLVNVYAPKINASLSKDLGLGFTANDAWSTLTTNYNDVMSDYWVQIGLAAAGVDLPSSINDDLGEYSTGKALDGLYYKVGEQEKNIRRNPWAWATTLVGDILELVFGSDD